MALTWTDWRGHDYTVGDTILYARMSGRSCEMAEGVIVDLMVMVRSPKTYKWTRVPDGDPVPTHLAWQYRNLDNPEEHYTYEPRNGNYEHVQMQVPDDHERRALITPTMRTSRFSSYEWGTKKWWYDEATGESGFKTVERKPIRLTVVESITVPVP